MKGIRMKKEQRREIAVEAVRNLLNRVQITGEVQKCRRKCFISRLHRITKQEGNAHLTDKRLTVTTESEVN